MVLGGILQGDAHSLQGNIINNATVDFNQSDAGTYAGDMSGSGSLFKNGNGSLTLTGTNSFTGGTSVLAGILQGDANSLQGSITNNAEVHFIQTSDGTYAGNMSGFGSLLKNGPGTLTLAGTNSYTGGTRVLGGILQGDTASLQGSINNSALVAFDQSWDGTYAGSISGTGGLLKSGAGTVTLTGPNSYSGGTTIAGGTLQGDTASLQGNIVDNANLTFSQAVDGTFAGPISGIGSLTKDGAGALTLAGTNSYSGGTTVSAGALVGTTSSLQGNIVNNADLIVDQSTAGTYAGNISGSGNLEKTGSGNVNFTGNHTYSGSTAVNQGTLSINGSLASQTTVGANGALGGNGSINANVTNQGTVGAGNSIGTLTINGDYTNDSSGIVQVEVNDAGIVPGVNNDLLKVNGTATINGGTVDVRPLAGNYIAGTKYTFLEANTLVGEFAGISGDFNSSLLNVLLGYTSDSAYFTLTTSYASIAQTSNELAVATYLDANSSNPNPDLQLVLSGLNTLSDDQARGAFNQMSGQLYGTLSQVGLQDTTLIVAQLSNRLRPGLFTLSDEAASIASPAQHAQPSVVLTSYSSSQSGASGQSLLRSPPPRIVEPWSGWALGLGIGGSASADGNATGLGFGLGGALVGLERNLDERHLFGAYGGYVGMALNTAGPSQSAQSNGGQFGAYLRGDDGFNYYSVIGGMEFDSYRTQRALLFDGIHREAVGSYGGWQSYNYLERGVTLRGAQVCLQPFGAMQYIYLRQNGFSETGAQSLDLSVSGIDTNSLRSLVGARMATTWTTRGGRQLFPQLQAIWLHEFLQTDTTLNAYFAPIGGGSFAVDGLNLGRDWALVGGGLNCPLGRGWSFSTSYNAQANARQVFHAGSGGVQLNW